MFNIKVDYPSLDEEKRILASTAKDEAVEMTKVLSGKAISNLQKLIRSVPVGDYVIDYVARLVRATRPKDPTANPPDTAKPAAKSAAKSTAKTKRPPQGGLFHFTALLTEHYTGRYFVNVVW